MPDRKHLNSGRAADQPRRSRPAQPGAGPSGPAPLPSPQPAVPIPDDDLVIVPPPRPEDFLKPPTAATERRIPRAKSTGIRRTLVPLMLTHGLFLPMLGVLWFFTEDDSPFRRLGIATPIVLVAVGAALLFVGALNVLSLKDMSSNRQDSRVQARRAL